MQVDVNPRSGRLGVVGREIQERIKCRSRIRIQKCFPQSRLADFVDGQILAFIPRITKTQLPVLSLEIIAKFPQLAAQTNIEEIILVSELFMSWTGVPTLGWWFLVGAADFNRDSHPDYVLLNSNNAPDTAIWYLSGRTFVGSAYGPSVPSGWGWVATGDFNGDGHPDYVLYNPGTRQTAIWYLNNNVYVSGGYGPTLPNGWALVGAADFNRDGHPDYVLEHVTGQTAIWYLSGRTFVGSAYGPTVRSGWGWAGTADFNGDGNPDYVLYNADTRQTAIWYLNNNVYTGSAWGPTLPAGWSLVAAWCAPWDYGYGCCQ